MDYICEDRKMKIGIEKEAKQMSDEIVDRLIAYRKELRMTQQDIADATGIQRANIARLEGKKYTASVESLKKYAKCVGYELNFIMEKMEDGACKLPLPVGHSDFKRVASEFCYVDKTLLIKEILDEKAGVYLFTRPRRFGKSLNMDMLRVFFEKTEEDTAKYFMDKKIWRCGERYQRYQAKYPVIYLTFKDVKFATWEEAVEYLRSVFATEYNRHPELFESEKCNEYEKRYFFKVASGEASEMDLVQSLEQLSRMLHKHHGTQAVILIDEYDIPIQQGYMRGYYEKAVTFIRILFSTAFKDNPHLFYGFLTGILRVAKESIFSGLNNIKVNSILDERYSEYFGFTPEEVQQLTKYYGVPEKYEEICEWYDGYRFGNTDIFNPWSVIGYFGDGCRAKAYWTSTSSNDIIGEVLGNADEDMLEDLHGLLQGKSVLTRVDTGIIYPQLKENINSVYSFLLITGYLKLVQIKNYDGEKIYEVAIPNREVLFVYEREILSKIGGIVTQTSVNLMQKAIGENDIESLKKSLQKMLLQMISYYDASNESFYHGFVLGLCALFEKRYYVTSNRESGKGRFDIQLVPKNEHQAGIIFELKSVKKTSEVELQRMAQEALEQTYTQCYDTDMKMRGITEVYRYGVAFCGKDVAIAMSCG